LLRVANAMNMSRSVTTPTSLPSSMTGSMPQSVPHQVGGGRDRRAGAAHRRFRGHDILDAHDSIPHAAVFAALAGS
jgi:hypothetical protein